MKLFYNELELDYSHQFTESEVMNEVFFVKKWQSNGFYPLYKIENGKMYCIKQNNHLVQSFIDTDITELVYILNNNCFIRTTNLNEKEFN